MISIIISSMDEPQIGDIIRSIQKSGKEKMEILVVDASSDSTPSIAKAAGARVIKQKSTGKGGAMKEGAKAARGSKIIFMDADNSTAPLYALQIARLLDTSDMAVATQWKMRSLKGASLKDIVFVFGPLMIIRMFIRILGFMTTEPITGLRGFRKSSWKKLDIRTNDFRIETEIEKEAAVKGLKINEIYMPLHSRLSGSKFLSSPHNFLKVVKFMYTCGKSMRKIRPVVSKKGNVRTIDYRTAAS